MFIKSIKSQAPADVFLFIFASFMYFIIGYPILKSIIDGVWLANNPDGLLYFFGVIIPFIPVIGLVYWGYVLGSGESLIVREDTGGFE